MDLYTLLIIGHLLGTVLGVGGATFIEINISRALADGKIDAVEGGFLGAAIKVLRVGLAVSLVTGFGFVMLYIANEQFTRLLNPVLWAKLVMVVIVAINALLLQAHAVNLYWGSALSFVTWWTTALLGIFLTNGVRYGFFTIMLAYIVAVAGGALVLDWLRKRHQAPPKTNPEPSS